METWAYSLGLQGHGRVLQKQAVHNHASILRIDFLYEQIFALFISEN